MSIYAERLDKVRSAMSDQGMSTLILTPGAAMRYLTGFSETGHERLLALVVPRDAHCLFITPSLNAAQALDNPAQIKDVRIWDDGSGWEKLLAEISIDLTLDLGVIAIDDDMPARFAVKIQQMMPTTNIQLTSPIFENIRGVKDTLELAALQHAADATDAAIAVAFAACRPGVTELEAALQIQAEFARGGHQPSFDTIVAAGANGASPHHHTGKTRIKSGDIVVLDFGARVDGYCGDITRVTAVDKADDEARMVYDIVYQAHQAGIAAVQPGATAHDVDAAARQVIIDAGYGEFFLHRTGHGIGLDEHESPNIVAGNHTKLLPGHCFSIEPGIYLPGKFGIRLENIATVAEDGKARVFNRNIPAELPVV